MTKSGLIRRISEIYPYMNMKNVEKIVSIVLSSILNALGENRRIELRGFGTFGVKLREASERRNPKTGEKVFIRAKTVPYFKAGKQLKDLINGRIPLDRE